MEICIDNDTTCGTSEAAKRGTAVAMVPMPIAPKRVQLTGCFFASCTLHATHVLLVDQLLVLTQARISSNCWSTTTFPCFRPYFNIPERHYYCRCHQHKRILSWPSSWLSNMAVRCSKPDKLTSMHTHPVLTRNLVVNVLCHVTNARCPHMKGWFEVS